MNVKELFSDISGTYDLLNKVLSFGTDRSWRRKATALLPHGENLKILDLASGTMDLALSYLDQGAGEIYAVDFALPMLLQGRQKISPTLDSRINVVCGDGLSLPFPENYFDAAMCAWGVRNFPNAQTNLEEMQRTLKPGGQFLVIEFFKPSKPFSKLFSKTYGRYVIPALGQIISKNRDAYEYLHNSIQGFLTRKEYEEMMQANSFKIIKSKDLSGGISSLVLAEKMYAG